MNRDFTTAGRRDRRPLVLLVLAFLALGLVYDAATPIFEAGDEQFHYPYVRHIAIGEGLPYQDASEVQAWRQEGSQPPLYYLIGALATFWIDTSDAEARLRVNPHALIGLPAHDSNDNRNMLVHSAAENFPYQQTTLAVHLIRWLSLLMGAGTLYAIYHLAWRIARDDAAALLAAALVAFNPMFVFLSAAVNNDNLIVLLASLALWQMARIWQDGITMRRVLLLAVLIGLAALTKISALGLVGVAGLMLMAQVWQGARSSRQGQREQGTGDRGQIVRSLITVQGSLLTPVLLIAGWWYARNLMLYGDATGLNRMLAIVGTRAGTPQLLPLLQAEAEGMWLSFWGLFGGVNILAAPWFYAFVNVLVVLALFGFGFQLAQWMRGVRNGARPAALLWLLLWLVVLLAAWSRWTLVTPATQGRLIFPALAAISVPLAVGLIALVPRRAAPPFSALLALLLFALALRTALFDIAPSYRPAPLLADVPRAAFREPLRFGGVIELVGVELPQEAVHSGETVEVALYWRQLRPVERDYSLFVHLLDVGELIVGQRDSYPGLGLRPTSQLRAGSIVRDVYRIAIDPSALAPSELQIRAGVYDFATDARLMATMENHIAGDNPLVGTLALAARGGSVAPNPVSYNFQNYFSLVGYQIDRVALRAGETFTLTLYWQARGPAPKDYSIFTHVLGQQDALWGQVDRQLPMTQWQKDALISDVYAITLKPDTPPDVYELEIGAYDLHDNFKRLGVWGRDGQYVGDRILLRKIRVLPR